MAQAVIGGVTYAIVPFRLRQLREAAPFIDRISARSSAGELTGVQGVAEAAFDMLSVLAVGIEGVGARELEALASLEELAALRTTFDQVLEEAGLTRPPGDAAGEGGASGEARPAGPAASPAASTTSSPSLSPAAAATGTS